MEEEKEEWKDVDGFIGLYQVSNLGRIKGMDRVVDCGRCFRKISERMLNPYLNDHGYLMVSLGDSGRKKYFTVHSLVAVAFLGHTPCGYNLVIDHINGIPTDNRSSNLRIVTHRENTSFCYRKNQSTFSSSFVGVCFYPRDDKWRASIQVNGMFKSLGRFNLEMDASTAYNTAVYNLSNGTFDEYYASIKRNNASKFRGVCKKKNYGKWQASIYLDGKQKYLGVFKSEIDACNAYSDAAIDFYFNNKIQQSLNIV